MAHGSLDGMATRDFSLCFVLAALLYSTIGQTFDHLPEFLAPLENHTVTQGRDVFFTCVVNHLQSYKVAWIKSDSHAILAMHTHMVAPNPRLSVTHNGHNTWKLHVYNVQRNDSGTYMCQVNTDPMRSQTGHMEVLIPPDITDLDDNDDQPESVERGEVRLSCHATGTPKPEVTWRREDGRPIMLRAGNSRTIEAKAYKNEQLHLSSVLRQDMGAYLCIATNGVPPSVSKRYYVNVLFKPTIKIRDQIVYAQLNSDVTLECLVESSPRSLTTWYINNGIKVVLDDRHKVTETAINDYTYQVNLTISRTRQLDFTTFICFTENSYGKTSATLRLQEYHKSKSTISPRKSLVSSGKGRKHHNTFNFDPRKSNSFSDKSGMTSHVRYDDDEDEEHIMGVKYSHLPVAPGAHFSSTDIPGSRHYNDARINANNQVAKMIVVCLVIRIFVLC